jgi:hypothetical protein
MSVPFVPLSLPPFLLFLYPSPPSAGSFPLSPLLLTTDVRAVLSDFYLLWGQIPVRLILGIVSV